MLFLFENGESLALRASRLRLVARTLADGMKIGSYKSMYHGQGVEFSGVREYLRGDDVRSIDWNVTARMGKPYVKLFEEDRELLVFLIVDRSLSMFTGSRSGTKLSTAAETAALLILASEQNTNPVGCVLFDGSICFSTTQKTGKDHSSLLLSKLGVLPEKAVKGSVLDKAIKGANKLLKKRSLVFIISDFRTTGYEDELARLAIKHDVIAVRCTDESDSNIPEVGCISFFDVESGVEKLLPTSAPSFRRKWKEEDYIRKNRWEKLCYSRGVIPLNISTSDDPAIILSRFFTAKDSFLC